MNRDKLIDVSEKIDSIDTFESYSDVCYHNDNNLIVPFIKLELIEQDVIGNNEKRVNLEFSYLIFEGIKEISWIGENNLGKRIVGGKKIADKEKADFKNWIAINRDSEGYEIKIIFEKLHIFLPTDSRTGTQWWTHRETPNFPQNIKTEIAKDFFALKNVPEQLKKILNLESYYTLSFENAEDKEIELIQTNWAE